MSLVMYRLFDRCERVANHYQYTVTFTGVGKGGKGTEHLGQCTQIAVFTKHEDCERCETEENQIESARSYTLVMNLLLLYIRIYVVKANLG